MHMAEEWQPFATFTFFLWISLPNNRYIREIRTLWSDFLDLVCISEGYLSGLLQLGETLSNTF